MIKSKDRETLENIQRGRQKKTRKKTERERGNKTEKRRGKSDLMKEKPSYSVWCDL